MIFLDTNVVSETLKKNPEPAVIARLIRHDAQLALTTVTIAEIACRIGKIRPDEGASRLELGLADWRQRFAGRIFGLTEEAALAYGTIMGQAALKGRSMSAPDGMIATMRKLSDFSVTGLDLICPWDF